MGVLLLEFCSFEGNIIYSSRPQNVLVFLYQSATHNIYYKNKNNQTKYDVISCHK